MCILVCNALCLLVSYGVALYGASLVTVCYDVAFYGAIMALCCDVQRVSIRGRFSDRSLIGQFHPGLLTRPLIGCAVMYSVSVRIVRFFLFVDFSTFAENIVAVSLRSSFFPAQSISLFTSLYRTFSTPCYTVYMRF